VSRPLWIVGLVLVVLAAILIAFLATHAAKPCEGVDVDEISDERRMALLERGWRGIPGDGREALYPRGCLVPEQETTHRQYDGTTLTPGSGA
jgi:hypothetical protein